MGPFIEVVLGGLMAGVLYSLVALGFVLIYKASGVFNFAQGAMVLLAALAFARFSEVMHRVESILDRIRKEQLKPDNDVINLLLEACDIVREQTGRLKDKGDCDDAALDALYEQLNRFVPAETSLRAVQSLPTPASG